MKKPEATNILNTFLAIREGVLAHQTDKTTQEFLLSDLEQILTALRPAIKHAQALQDALP